VHVEGVSAGGATEIAAGDEGDDDVPFAESDDEEESA
jgi:hypothetical protein